MVYFRNSFSAREVIVCDGWRVYPNFTGRIQRCWAHLLGEAKRALREHVVQRRIMGCFRSGKGTGIYETVMTVLASWKQQSRNLSKTLDETLAQEWTKS
jgi:hypothetical protein